jgi:Transglutaminase-like superfamily
MAVGSAVPGCARTATARGAAGRDERRVRVVAPARAELDLSWLGYRVGRAVEELVARGGGSGYRLARVERWRAARGGHPVEWQVEVIVDADEALRGEKIVLFRDRRPTGSARRAREGWLIETAGEAPRLAPADAEPAELVMRRMMMAGEDRWAGRVLLAGLDFAVARLEIEAEGGGAWRATLSGTAGRLETRMWLRRDGSVERAAGPDLSARRADGRQESGLAQASASGAAWPAEADAPGLPGRPGLPGLSDLPDLIGLGALRVSGHAGAARAIEIEAAAARPGDRRRELDGGAGGAWPPLAIPDPAPVPELRALADRMAGADPAPLDQLRALARGTADRLEDDLTAGPVVAAADVAAAGRADCVGHAVLFSALARARGFDVRLVTGYRLDRRVLVRHMWALVRVGRASVAIDPTRGDVPVASGRYLALAIHGSAAGEIALSAELAFAGLSGATARFAHP